MATEIRALIEEGVARLRRATDDPRREAELLLADALGRSRASLLANPEERILDCDATDRYESHVTRRAIGEPVAYILGEKEFWSLTLAVTPDVLVPRPETELVVERALAHLAARRRRARVLDLATGSGAIALAIARERPACRVFGTDVSGAAIALATANAQRLGLANARFETGTWYEPAERRAVRRDHVQSAVRCRRRCQSRLAGAASRAPSGAVCGPTGLEALQTVIAGAAARLLPAGWLVLEHGSTQGEAVRALLAAARFREVSTFRDLAGHERCT